MFRARNGKSVLTRFSTAIYDPLADLTVGGLLTQSQLAAGYAQPFLDQLHWVLDVGFREDQSRAAQGYCAENLAVIRHLALNLLSQEKSAKGGTRAKRLKAVWDDDYLTKILSQVPTPSRKL